MKRIIIIFILIAFISCRDKKNANNAVAESTDTEVAIATLKAFYSSVYNGSLDNQEVLFKQYVSKQLLEKIDIDQNQYLYFLLYFHLQHLH